MQTLLFNGDISTGDLSQWGLPQNDVQLGTTDRLQVVPNPLREGAFALQATVHGGDRANNGERAELVCRKMQFSEGQTLWFHWETLWPMLGPGGAPNSFSNNPWAVWMQLHDNDIGVPVEFASHGLTMEMHINRTFRDRVQEYTEGVLWNAQMYLDAWQEFSLHIHLSSRADGFVELFHNGELVVTKTFLPTLDPANKDGRVFLKQGFYRAPMAPPQTILHRGMQVWQET